MKKISLFIAIFALMSCGHKKVAENPVFDRSPSSTTQVESCGLLGSTETSRNAVDVNHAQKIDDRLYSLQIDCNKDLKVDLDREKLVVGIPATQMRPGQKGWITRWRKAAIKEQKNHAAKPYMCIRYHAAYDPCVVNKNVYGVAPEFSKKVK